MIAIIPERVIGLPRNTDRHRPESPDITSGRNGLLFQTRNGTPYLHNNLQTRWLNERLKPMGLDEPRMGWHAFRRFRKTWLRGKRCQEDINNFWMGHKPKTMSELYSRIDEELEQRLQEAEN